MIIYTCPKCGADLLQTIICTVPPIPAYDCRQCGWHYEEEPDQDVVRVVYKPKEG